MILQNRKIVSPIFIGLWLPITWTRFNLKGTICIGVLSALSSTAAFIDTSVEERTLRKNRKKLQNPWVTVSGVAGRKKSKVSRPKNYLERLISDRR